MDFSTFTPNYFSLEDIIASQIRVPCKTLVDLPNFGFLEPSLNSENLPAGVDLELPLWVAQTMAKPGRRYVSVNVPKKYKEAYRSVLKADATVVDLNKMGPHFYQSGLHLSTLPTPESEHVAAILPEVLQKRLQSMLDSYTYTTAVQSADDATSAQKGTMMKETHMDALEHRVYNDAKKGSEVMQDWLENRIGGQR